MRRKGRTSDVEFSSIPSSWKRWIHKALPSRCHRQTPFPFIHASSSSLPCQPCPYLHAPTRNGARRLGADIPSRSYLQQAGVTLFPHPQSQRSVNPSTMKNDSYVFTIITGGLTNPRYCSGFLISYIHGFTSASCFVDWMWPLANMLSAPRETSPKTPLATGSLLESASTGRTAVRRRSFSLAQPTKASGLHGIRQELRGARRLYYS